MSSFSKDYESLVFSESSNGFSYNRSWSTDSAKLEKAILAFYGLQVTPP